MANIDFDDNDEPEGAPPRRDDGFDLHGDESRRMAAFWREQIDDYGEDNRRWHKRGRTIERRYRDERNRVDEEGQRRFSSLWMNVETLLPALFGRVPVPVAERRFKDKDPVGRSAATMLERALRNEVAICGYGDAVEQAVKDYLLAGRGIVWVRYEPQIEEGVSLPPSEGVDTRDAQGEIEEEDDSEDEEKLRDTGDRISRESTPVDHIQWSDFAMLPSRARTWKEVTAIAKRVYMTKDGLRRRFGDEIGKAVPTQKDDRERRRQNESVKPEERNDTKAEVWEIWDRDHERVDWIAEGYDYLCDRQDDPLELEGFFPIPKPLCANWTTNTLTPVPDYMQYQDQAIQIDELCQRIAMLCKACKVAGTYNAASADVRRLLDESVENELIPVDDWATFAEKGGVSGAISLMPLKEVIGVIDVLTKKLDAEIQQMDRLTGITDVMRGTGDARETLGGVRLKTNSSGTRLTSRQNRIATFCADTVKIMADIMCKHFTPRSLIEASGALYEEGLGPESMDLVAPDVPPDGLTSTPNMPPRGQPSLQSNPPAQTPQPGMM